MGISLSQWRATIGYWCGGILHTGAVINCTTNADGSCCSLWFNVLIVAVLLVIGGVEKNPGPRQNEAVQSHYKKTRGFANMSGELYEVKMSSLLFLRGFSYQQEFHIASNMDAAGCFDDVVFTIGREAAFIQLKHREKQQSKIYKSQLIQLKGDFSLLKYCKSYLGIKQNWNKNKDLQSCGRFEDSWFIVFTNAGLVEGIGNSTGSSKMHEFINTEGKCICFTEDSDEDIYKIFERLPHYREILTQAVDCEKVVNTTELLEIIQKLHNNNAKQVPSKEELKKLLKDIQSLGDLSGSQEFLSHLCFCTEQKSEKDLDILIRNEIKDICGTDAVFEKFMLGTQNWWRNTNLYLTEQTNFWQEILMSCVDNICKQIPDMGVNFSEGECDVMRKKLSSAGRCCHLKTSCMQLSSLKVVQCLGTKLLVDVRTLETRLNEVLAVWRLGTSGNVLLVEGWTDCKDVITGINRILDGYSDRKFIVVMEADTSCDDAFNLSQLDQKSQDKILNEVIMFQGLSVRLQDLADRITLTEAVTADIALQLLSGSSTVIVGQRAADLDPSYITRTLLRKECVNKRIFRDEDVRIAVSGMSVDEIQELLPLNENVQVYHEDCCISGTSTRIFLIDGAAEFAAVCEFSESVHWIQKKNKNVVWKSSHGDLVPIKKYLEDKMVTYSTLDKVLKLPQQLFLVFGEPGIGKSTEMTHLNQMLKQSDPSTWVVRVDLNDHTQFLNEDHPNPVELLMTAGKFVNIFERHLLEHQINNGGKIILIFDGFDEISPRYSDKVIAILRDLLGKKIKQIWVTSRLLLREDLEKDLCSLAFKFQHFTSSDENEFLLKFWKVPGNDNRLNDFTTRLLEVTRKSLNDKLIKLTGIPLHMKMLAEVFEPQALLYCETGKIDLPCKLDMLTLYNSFIDRKWKVYYSKINIDVTKVGLAEDYEEIRVMFQKKLMNFALVALLGIEELKSLHNSEKIFSKNRELLEKFKLGRERTGLVIDVVQNSAVFVHKTFAEYFVALWISQNFSSNTECVRGLYIKREFQMLRNFLDRILAQHCDIHVAVLNQDKYLVKRLLSREDCNVNERDNGGRTALHLAVANYLDVRSNKDHDVYYIIRVLIDHGADCRVEDKVLHWMPLRLAEELRAWSPLGLFLERKALTRELVVIPQNLENDKLVRDVLRVAAVRGYVNLVKFMFNCGVDVEHRIALNSRNEVSLLHISAGHNQHKLVKFLVEQKADIEARDALTKTPLMWAAECGYIKMVKLLIKLGARIDTCDRLGNTAFYYAVLNNKLKIMPLFKQYAFGDLNCDIFGNNALHCAAVSGYVDWVTTLLDFGIDVDCKNLADFTSLMLASMFGKLKFVESLLMHGAGVNVSTESGKTAIFYAANYGNFEVVKLLRQHGADIAVCDEQGNTILHGAAFSGNLECVKLIMEYGMDVNSKNNNDETPLLLAAKKGAAKVLDYLLKEGADVSARKKGGSTALHEAANGGNLGCVTCLLNCGLDVDVKNDMNLTPLWVAAQSGKLKIVNLLVDNGANLGVQDKKGNTVLHAAASEGHLNVVDWLVKQGIDVAACNVYGETALQIAERSMSYSLSSNDEKKSAVIAFLRKTEEEQS